MTAPGPYSLVVKGRAWRDLNKLGEPVAAALMEFMVGPLVADPKRIGKPLRRRYEGMMGARRGPYRVIYGVDEVARLVTVIHVDHRADVYRA